MSDVNLRPINRVPTKLLKLLGISGPDSPDRLRAEAQGVVDLLPWWLHTAEQEAGVAIAVVAGTSGVSSSSILEVPAGAFWIVVQFGLFMASSAGVNALRVTGIVYNPVSLVRYPVGPTSDVWTATGGVGAVLDCLGPRPNWIIIPAGLRLAFSTQDNTGAANCNVQIQARYCQFEA